MAKTTNSTDTTVKTTKDVPARERKAQIIPITRAKAGMELSKDIFSRNDQVILNKGTILDAQMIAKIMFYSIDSIAVYADETEREQTMLEKLSQSEDYKVFEKQFNETLDGLKTSLTAAVDGDAEIEEDYLFSEVEHIIKTTGSNKYVFDMLYCMRSYDEQTYVHSLDVAIINNCFARWLGMSDEDKRALTLGGLLHDIGKIKIPHEVLNKPGKLSAAEYSLMKSHAEKGYEILERKRLDERVKRVALEHHERYDRTGYPMKKSGAEIEPFAMITAIADVYDAMTSNRVYRSGICPFEVVKLLESEGKQQYDPRYLIPLLEQITEVYIHHTVRLSNDELGKIILINRDELSKPVVMVGNECIDLARRRELSICEVL